VKNWKNGNRLVDEKWWRASRVWPGCLVAVRGSGHCLQLFEEGGRDRATRGCFPVHYFELWTLFVLTLWEGVRFAP